MSLEEIIEKSPDTELNEYQIHGIEKQIDEYIKNNNTASNPIIEVCPRCGKVHPKLIQAGRTRNGKQMLRCKDCNKHFVSVNILFTLETLRLKNPS